MIYGIGCDVVNLERMATILERQGEQFLQRLFTVAEIANAPDLEAARIAYYAKRFAAKEAFAKALGTGIGGVISFKEIEIQNNANGKPFFKNAIPLEGEFAAHLSLADDHPCVVAFVIIEEK